jgi:hypothetical protein
MNRALRVIALLALAGFTSWLFGIGIAIGLGPAFTAPSGAMYSSKARLFVVPGSRLPLVLIMAIFFIKYAVGGQSCVKRRRCASTLYRLEEK